MKKIISIVLVLCTLFSMSTIDVLAAYDDSFSVTYGGKTLPLNQYNPNNESVYFTNDGGPCPKHINGASKNCKNYNGASQCLGFAFYVQDSLFGFHYRKYDGLNAEKFNIITSFTPNSNNKVDCIKTLFSNVTLGAHIRTKKGHSMIFAAQNNDYIWTYEGNSDYRCGVHFKKRTWTEMYDYLADQGVGYIASPKSQYYTKDNNLSLNINKGKKCTHPSYNSYGKCTNCGQEYSMSVSSMTAATYQAVKNDVPVRNRPYSPEKIVKYLSKGTQVTVVASGKNSIGNLWYKLSDNTWIYSKNLEKVNTANNKQENTPPIQQASTLEINLTNYPTSITQGNIFSLRGTVRSNYTINSVRGYIIDQSGNIVQTTTDFPNSTSMDIRPANLNQKLIFNNLPAGRYQLKVVAQDASGENTDLIKSFAVVLQNSSSPQASSPVARSQHSSSIRFELESIPKGNLSYGKAFSLKGWFRSDSAIVEARAYILDANQNIVMEAKASSTTANYQIQGYKLDKGMQFNKLDPGGYYLKYFVRDADGDTATWVSDMFYIVK